MKARTSVAVVAAAEVQGNGALAIGLEGRYGEAKHRRERVAELGDHPVDEGVEGRELGAYT